MTEMTNQPRVVVTTSWDDGHHLDPKLAALLDKYDVPGTFYIAPRNIEIDPANRLSHDGIRELTERHEIGGHTLSHKRLPFLSDDEARHEIQAGKDELEQIIGAPITTFCYPRGEYNAKHVGMVRESGFGLARTVDRHSLEVGDLFEAKTTINAYAHLVDGPTILRIARMRPAAAVKMYFNWEDFAMAWFDKCLREGGVYHLWGHSWEVDARGDWARLERVLDYICRRPDVEYVPNGALIA
ncbi:Polysaccharide deacetylase [Actinoplanes regularis]|uniref:Polysaccharide deacetylase n=2 Tax=Actinoplanes regularis TaxID=52697 RepID=A0A238X754_9ACTN|nr:endo-1,4-beta-xylanase [Actinoplanes regularis]SNR54418.1 Polysaccharide deacetylase [Actinoplanes regularis]